MGAQNILNNFNIKGDSNFVVLFFFFLFINSIIPSVGRYDHYFYIL